MDINAPGTPCPVQSATAKSKEGNLSSTEDINSEIKKPIIFGVMGGGYEMSEKVTAFGEYHFGLSNASSGDGSSSKFNLFNLGVIYSLRK